MEPRRWLPYLDTNPTETDTRDHVLIKYQGRPEQPIRKVGKGVVERMNRAPLPWTIRESNRDNRLQYPLIRPTRGNRRRKKAPVATDTRCIFFSSYRRIDTMERNLASGYEA